MIWSAPAGLPTAQPDAYRASVMSAVLRLAEDCDYDADHAHHVGRLALEIFDDLHPLHGYGPDDRFTLHLAALLHDIGQIGGPRGHHKRALRFILDCPALPMDRLPRLIVGCIARYHRKALPRADHRHYRALGESDRKRVAVLAGLLRMADALDRGHECLVTELSVAATPRSILFDCETRDIERVHQVILPIRKSNLLERVFGRRVCCVWQQR
jgi:exopolyphosphatase/guanosine-5'-triphosphate,3'-diphosphate pyrophosphatase